MLLRSPPPAQNSAKTGPLLSPLNTGPRPAGMRPLWVVVLASFWIATVCNLALWRTLARLPDLSGGQAVTVSIALALVIGLATAGLLSVLAWRWTLKPVIMLFCVSAAFGAYFMLAYGVVIDKTMMINTLQTDMRETRDLLNWRLLATVLVLAVLPCVLLWRQHIRLQSPTRQAVSNLAALLATCALLVVVVMLFFQSIASVMRNNPQVRYLINPLNSFYALGSVAARPFQRDESALLPLGQDAKLGASYTAEARPPLLLLVLGETGRSGNFALNGYGRPTTPELAQENVISQRNAWSCGTSTAASVPCMFSHFGRANYESRPANYEGLMDVLQHAGLAVLWLDNQSGCKGACDRIPTVDTSQLKVPGLCDGGECFDEVMLQGLDARIAALPAERRAKGVVVVMHQMGSHGPAYFKRSPAAFKKFLPECTNNSLQSCEQQGLLNAYDNSVVYTDHLLASSIQWLKAQEPRSSPALLYLADHGESLGENNIYLHGMPYSVAPEVQKHVPWITWLSPGFEQRNKITTACLKQKLDAPISHDNYFHSVLGLMDVQTSVYLPALDIYAGCQTGAAQGRPAAP
ncbi:phosphoethanolamine transferase [Polaromonas sp.]|uniref:phosphoethanolamine transferase n=1 Tax=Polaromonas sp. TaxID=1869339 RepID=UPI003BB54291